MLDLQIVSDRTNIPAEDDFLVWTEAVLNQDDSGRDWEVVIRIVDDQESAELNQQYRQKEGPTNVLSFPFEAPFDIPLDLLGDIVICAPVVAKEANEQGKPAFHHWAHMVVHGTLHLLGYDHIVESDAEAMEALEIQILRTLSIPNPYQEE